MELPHAGPPKGHRYTKFQEPTFAYCYWTDSMRASDIPNPEADIVGFVHDVQLEQIFTILKRLESESR